MEHPASYVEPHEAEQHVALLRRGHLHPQHVPVRALPSAPGRVRTALVSLRGFYEFEISGPWAVNLTRLVAHRLGVVSLPEFARGLRDPQAPGGARR